MGAAISMGKERDANHKELAQQLARIEKMKTDGKDEYDIKKQVKSPSSHTLSLSSASIHCCLALYLLLHPSTLYHQPFFLATNVHWQNTTRNFFPFTLLSSQYEVLEECKMMFPNTQKRLEAAHADLSAIMVCGRKKKRTMFRPVGQVAH